VTSPPPIGANVHPIIALTTAASSSGLGEVEVRTSAPVTAPLGATVSRTIIPSSIAAPPANTPR
jgi:hypothetical protein